MGPGQLHRGERAIAARLRHLDVMERITQIHLASDAKDAMLGKILELVHDTFSADRAFLLFPCDPQAP
ncbi:MAG TPA: hypothetical protein VIT92_03470, partial [Burkholderiaceae bacterium]